MKKIKLVYNPFAGNKAFKYELDACVNILQDAGFDVNVCRSNKKGDIERNLSLTAHEYDSIIVSGGDGTINIVVNTLMKNNVKAKLGIIPSGTANDFATHLGLNGLSTEECCQIIADGHLIDLDLGYEKNSDRYFINVCVGGLISAVSQNVNEELKNVLGKMSYYLDGIKQVPNFYPIPLEITNSQGTFKEDVFLFLIMNGSGAGSFEHLAKYAKINDGKLDFVAVKAKPLISLTPVFLKILRGEHLNDPNITYFQDKKIKIRVLDDNPLSKSSDMDGEKGPELPLDIEIVESALQLYAKKIEL